MGASSLSSSAATMAAADDDVPMREADAGLGFDEHDGARAGAFARPSAPGAQRNGPRFRAAAGGDEEGRSARGGAWRMAADRSS